MSVLILLLALVTPPTFASLCTAECLGCDDSAPNCSANCLNGSAHCQDGECGGYHVGCCCISHNPQNGSGRICLSLPCGIWHPGDFLTSDTGLLKTSEERWALLEYVVASSGEIQGVEARYASSTAYAASLVRDMTQATVPVTPDLSQELGGNARLRRPADGGELYTAFVLDPGPGHKSSPLSPQSLDALLAALNAGLLGADRETGVFAIRQQRDTRVVLFSEIETLSEMAGQLLPDARAEAGIAVQPADTVDFFVFEASEGALRPSSIAGIFARWIEAPIAAGQSPYRILASETSSVPGYAS